MTPTSSHGDDHNAAAAPALKDKPMIIVTVAARQDLAGTAHEGGSSGLRRRGVVAARLALLCMHETDASEWACAWALSDDRGVVAGQGRLTGLTLGGAAAWWAWVTQRRDYNERCNEVALKFSSYWDTPSTTT
eukprot:jgi/Chlat1/6706/Chrsp5S06993